jgi:hypothetical protein
MLGATPLELALAAPSNHAPASTTAENAARSERQSDAYVHLYGRDERKRKVSLGVNREELCELRDDLVRAVYVLARDKCLIRHSVPALEHPLSRYSARQRVRSPTFAGDHGEKLSSVLVEETPRLRNARRQVWQMLEDVNREISVK